MGFHRLFFSISMVPLSGAEGGGVGQTVGTMLNFVPMVPNGLERLC